MNINEFLNQLDDIRSFNGKIKLADQNFKRVGSGSGRVVYSITDDRVLKLAKNSKGIAQNQVESNIGDDYTAKHIVANVFDSADDNSWVLAEKSKKVTEKRIKELTNIPSLWDLQKFLVNQIDSNKGRRSIYGMDQEMVDFFWENEFSSSLIEFAVNYGQSVGDMGRPSTYGEVMKDGQPTIVLTDYGLSDEVYDTHYNKKSKYNLYELHHASVDYGDYLGDIGNVSQEVRHGMWAFVPASVGDGDEINEEFVNFVLDKPIYPKQPINRLPQLLDIFYSNLNNLNLIIKSVEDPISYIKNLVALQNYLILNNLYDRQPIVINNKPELTEEILNEGIKRDMSDYIAQKIAEKRGYNQINYIGSGMFGSAYDIGDNKILKITSDHTEANENIKLRGKPLKYIAKPYEVSKIKLKNKDDMFFIVLEKLTTKPDIFKKHVNKLDDFFVNEFGDDFYDIIVDYVYYGWNKKYNTIEFRKFMENNPETSKYFYDLINIADELKKYGIRSLDFLSPNNLGYKNNGNLAFFDVGFGDYFQPVSDDIKSIEIDENFGGATKFTTDDDVSSDGFPAYNNIDTSSSINNNLNANSAMYNEELNNMGKNKMKKEGVGDKYLNREYPRQFNDDDEFERNFLKHTVKDVTLTPLLKKMKLFRGGDVQKCELYENPSTLRKFNDNVRGLVMDNGDYFICGNETALHQEIAMALKSNGLIDISLPEEIYDMPDKIIPVIRRGNSDTLEIASSYQGTDMELVKNIFNKATSKSGGGVKFKAVVNNSTLNENNDNYEGINEDISSIEELGFISEIESLGGKIYSVGGAVRDEFLGKESKDLDILVTGIPIKELGEILSKYGSVKLVGESFGVYKFIPKGSSEEIDVAIPRTETPTGGGGHKDFDIKSDHTLPIEKDLYRRDFTINAIAKDIDGNIVDPYNGRKDLSNKIIRAVNPDAFSDDPLRILRAIQFASRFGFTIEPHTLKMIQKNLDNVGSIAKERRLIELEKIQKKGDMRYGAQLLKDTGLFKRLFDYELNQSIIDNAPFDKVNTVGEFIYLLLQESENPEELFKTRIHNIIDIYKEIKALKVCFNNYKDDLVHSRMLAHDMYLISPNTLDSQILPNKVLIASNDLQSSKYPKTVNELTVDGYDLMALGLKGNEIKKMKNHLLKNIYSDKITNNKEQLLNMVNNETSGIMEELNDKTIEKAKKNIPIQYTGIMIDELKAKKMLEMYSQYIPDDWEIVDKLHVTIKLGELKDYDKMKNYLGWPIHVIGTHIGVSDMAIALKVDLPNEIKSKNKIPHITLAYNKKNGGKPKDSNDIVNWEQLKRPIRIRGIFDEVPYNVNI